MIENQKYLQKGRRRFVREAIMLIWDHQHQEIEHILALLSSSSYSWLWSSYNDQICFNPHTHNCDASSSSSPSSSSSSSSSPSSFSSSSWSSCSCSLVFAEQLVYRQISSQITFPPLRHHQPSSSSSSFFIIITSSPTMDQPWILDVW